MKWESNSRKTLITVIRRLINETEAILARVYDRPAAEIRWYTDKLKVQLEVLERSEDVDMDFHIRTVKSLVDTIYSVLRKSMISLVAQTMTPFTADGLLNERDEDKRTVALLDKAIDGVFLYRDGDKIRVRTPPLPSRKSPEMYFTNSEGNVFKSYASNIFEASIRRVAASECKEHKLSMDIPGKKLIQILNVFPQGRYAPDNDNRDATGIINGICAFLPDYDSARTTSILHDAYVTDAVPEGTYVTVLPYGNGIPSVETTIEFWQKRLAENGYSGPF